MKCRYTFQGQEKDDEIKGGRGTSYNYTYRMHDPRLGRFFAVDPLTPKYPHYSPYMFSGNRVIQYKELEGLEEGATSPGFIIPMSPTMFKVVSNQIIDMVEGSVDGVTYVATSTDDWISNANYYYFSSPTSKEGGEHYVNSLNEDAVTGYSFENGFQNERFVASYGNVARGVGGLLTISSVAGTISRVIGFAAREFSVVKSTISAKNTTPQVGTAFQSLGAKIDDGLISIEGRAVSHGSFDYVVTLEGELRLGSGHFHLSGGASEVQAAGTMKLFQGKVKELTNSSGHYMPNAQQAANSAKVLESGGIDLSGTTLKIFNQKGVVEKSIKLE